MSEEMPSVDPQFYNQTYNALQSLLTYTSIYGSDTTISFEDVQVFFNKQVTQAIIFGTRIGAAGLALIVLWMVSKNRKTPIFIINQVSLILILLQSALYLAYLMRNFGGVAFALTLFPQIIKKNDLQIYAATNIVQCLLVASIEVSLIFQVRVIFKSDNFKKIGVLLTCVSSALGITTVTMWLFTAIKAIVAVYANPLDLMDSFYFNVSIILLACSINFMTLLLTVKLILAIRSRRFLGLKQFDSFHILLIMSTQTLIGPSIVYILAYALNENNGTQTLTSIAALLVVLSLPLSSMWATSANDATTPRTFASQFNPYNNSNSDGSSYISYGRTMYDKSSFGYSPQKSDGFSTKEMELSTQLEVDLESGESSHQSSNSGFHGYSPAKNKLRQIDDEFAADICTPSTVVDDETRAFWMNNMHEEKDGSLMQSKTVVKDLR